MIRRLFIAVGLAALVTATAAGCSPEDEKRWRAEALEAKGREGVLVHVATAPDGTNLWAFDPPGDRTVYFASSSTARTVGCGKNYHRVEAVPTAE